MAKADNRPRRTTIVVFFTRKVKAPIDESQFGIFDPNSILAFTADPGGGTFVRTTQSRISTGARVCIPGSEGRVTSCRRQNDRFQLIVEGLGPSDVQGLANLNLIGVLQ